MQNQRANSHALHDYATCMPESCCAGTVHARAWAMARVQNNLGWRGRSTTPVGLSGATALADAARKQRFVLDPAVFLARLRCGMRGRTAASFERRRGTYGRGRRGLAGPGCGRRSYESRSGTGAPHVKRTVCAKSTHWNPAIECGYFFFTGRCGAQATKQRSKIFRGICARAEAYCRLKRCC